eukprot:scaffold229960_cov52-Prasinocladus_malaysianus.AAC.1
MNLHYEIRYGILEYDSANQTMEAVFEHRFCSLQEWRNSICAAHPACKKTHRGPYVGRVGQGPAVLQVSAGHRHWQTPAQGGLLSQRIPTTRQ